MVAIRLILLSILFVTHQAAGAARCSGTTATTALVCDDSCNEVGRCVNGVWQRSQNCQASGQVCRAGSCVDAMSVTATEAYCNNKLTITCPAVTTPTKFPSLLDCTSYYICEPGVSVVYPSQCGGTAYNACRGTCSDPLTNGACPASSTIYCTSPGQVGIAPGNDALFYTCVTVASGLLEAQWNVCPSGYRFSLTSKQCEYVGVLSTCTVCAGAATLPSNQANPNSVCSYFVCYSRENFYVRYCNSGWYYVQSQGGCIWGGGSSIC